MNRFDKIAYDTWKTASPPEDDLDKYEGLIDENGYIDYDGLSLLLAENKLLWKRLCTLIDYIRATGKRYGEPAGYLLSLLATKEYLEWRNKK